MSALIALRYFMCACLLAYVYSCTVPPPMNIKDNAPVAEVSIGPSFKLLDVHVKKFSAVSNNDGQIHILAVSKQPRKLHYLTISKGEQINHKISDAKRYLDNVDWWDFNLGKFTLDAALDSKHRLHVIIGKTNPDYDRHHLIFEKGEWQELSNVRCEKIARYGDDLACAFRARQKDLLRFGGGNSRFGGENSGLGKLVVAHDAENGWLDWTVFDYPTRGYIWDFLIAGDNFGNLHTIYENSNLGRLVYAQIRPSADSNRNHDIDVKKKPVSVSGTVLFKLEHMCCYDMAIDADSGDGIIASIPNNGYYMHISKRGQIDDPIQFIKGPADGAFFRIAPSGNGGFQGIIYYTQDPPGALPYPSHTLAYIQYYENEWSQLSVMEEGFGSYLLFDIIYDGLGNALVIWREPRPGYLFGRWVSRKM